LEGKVRSTKSQHQARKRVKNVLTIRGTGSVYSKFKRGEPPDRHELAGEEDQGRGTRNQHRRTLQPPTRYCSNEGRAMHQQLELDNPPQEKKSEAERQRGTVRTNHKQRRVNLVRSGNVSTKNHTKRGGADDAGKKLVERRMF